MEKKVIRWGLLGAGAILDRWMKGAWQVEGMQIAAVASRTIETARRAAEKFHIPEALSYEEMLARKDIDVVYIPVPHTGHKDLAIRAMNAGKAVLVEKPAAVNAKEFEEMVECARKNQVFFMEAVWTRFFPMLDRIQETIASGKIGEVRSLHCTFSFRNPEDASGRIFDPMQAGGGLLDVGVYDLHFARMIFGREPEELIGLAAFDTDALHIQVDEQASFVAKYDGGELAVMTCGVRTDIPDAAYIYGTKGYLALPIFWKPTQMQIVVNGETETVCIPVPQKVEGLEDEGYQFEIAHVNACLRDGVKESPQMPWEVSHSILKQCDKLRNDWKFQYPFEV